MREAAEIESTEEFLTIYVLQRSPSTLPRSKYFESRLNCGAEIFLCDVSRSDISARGVSLPVEFEWCVVSQISGIRRRTDVREETEAIPFLLK